jgi:hypothetical protein
VRELYIRETEYRVINSVLPPPPEIVYLDNDEPRLGILGGIGMVVALAIGVVVFLSVSSCFAQSNIRQFYGHGDYGSRPAPQVIIVPVPVPQPRYFPGPAEQWKGR